MSDQRADRSTEDGLKPERVQKRPAVGTLKPERVQKGIAARSEEPAAAAEGEAESRAG